MQWRFCRQVDSFEIFLNQNFLGLANFCFNCTLEAALNTPSKSSKIPDYISLCERTLPGLADQTPALVRDSFKSESETRRLATSLRSPATLSHFPGDSSHKQHLLVNHFEERSFIFIYFISSDKLLSISSRYWKTICFISQIDTYFSAYNFK